MYLFFLQHLLDSSAEFYFVNTFIKFVFTFHRSNFTLTPIHGPLLKSVSLKCNLTNYIIQLVLHQTKFLTLVTTNSNKYIHYFIA